MTFEKMVNCTCGSRPHLMRRAAYSNYREQLYPDMQWIWVECLSCHEAASAEETQHAAVKRWNAKIKDDTEGIEGRKAWEEYFERSAIEARVGNNQDSTGNAA